MNAQTNSSTYYCPRCCAWHPNGYTCPLQIQADRKTTQPTGEKEAERNSNRWLDGMPYKELVWNSAFENMRKYANDNRVALQVEVVVLQRIVHSDEPPDILEKLSELADWLDGKMEWLEK